MLLGQETGQGHAAQCFAGAALVVAKGDDFRGHLDFSGSVDLLMLQCNRYRYVVHPLQDYLEVFCLPELTLKECGSLPLRRQSRLFKPIFGLPSL